MSRGNHVPVIPRSANAGNQFVLVLMVLLSPCTAALASTTTLHATVVPGGGLVDWSNAGGAAGSPCTSCTQDNSAWNPVIGSSEILWATGFAPFTLPAGQSIIRVEVDVHARYNADTTGDRLRVKVRGPVAETYANSGYWNQGSSDVSCQWRMGGDHGWDITDLLEYWDEAAINSLDVGVRWLNSSGGGLHNEMKVSAFRIVVTTIVDCNGNGVPDDEDIADGYSEDCNGNGVPDECDVDEGYSDDCNWDWVPDECQLAGNDCNQNGYLDECDIAESYSEDCNYDDIPDECQLAGDDCNGNDVPDECDVDWSSEDCNGDGIPDECQLAGHDCNQNQYLDECDIAEGWSEDLNGDGIPDECVPFDCNGNGVPDDEDIADGTSEDCNGNLVPDECDLAQGVSQDCNGNEVPDECDVEWLSDDCNWNGVPDECELPGHDCNENEYLDECDIAEGWSEDLNGDGIPDECVPVDCNGNGILDEQDIADGTSEDCNGNGVPDECDIADGTSPDVDGDGVPDECALDDCNGNRLSDALEIDAGWSLDCNGNGIPDECDLSPWAEEDRFLLPGPFPAALAYDGTWLYLVDLEGSKTIFVLDSWGGVVRSFPAPSASGSFDGADSVHGLVFDGNHLFAADFDAAQVFEIDTEGTQIFQTFAVPAPVRPSGIAYDGELLYVSDIDSTRILVYTPAGAPVREFEAPIRPADLAFDGENLVAIDIFSALICEFTTTGALIRTYVSPRRPDIWGMGALTFVDGALFLAEVTDPEVYDPPNLAGTIFVLDQNPDEASDCNANGMPDACDIADGNATDVNANAVPDECETIGDLNCDARVDLADINAFVLYMSNYAGWTATYPDCDPRNGDINGDGTYGQWALDDINPFVVLLSNL